MEGLTCLQTSQRAYRSHVTKIFNKVDETLANKIDELAITYLSTTVAQLEKKKEQIGKLDQQILDLIQDATELEAMIMDSEELQDIILEKVNELNKHVELFQLRPPTTPSQQESGENDEVTVLRSDHENVCDVASTLPTSLCNALNPTVSDTPVLCTTHDTPVINVSSDTPVVYASSGAPSTIVSNPSFTLPKHDSIPPYFTSPVSFTSIS